jgi:hypothetical protein
LKISLDTEPQSRDYIKILFKNQYSMSQVPQSHLQAISTKPAWKKRFDAEANHNQRQHKDMVRK